MARRWLFTYLQYIIQIWGWGASGGSWVLGEAPGGGAGRVWVSAGSAAVSGQVPASGKQSRGQSWLRGDHQADQAFVGRDEQIGPFFRQEGRIASFFQWWKRRDARLQFVQRQVVRKSAMARAASSMSHK